MSADVLHKAANAIRDEWETRGDEGTSWHQAVVFHLRVADWLEATADRAERRGLHLQTPVGAAALAAAHAYLGETS